MLATGLITCLLIAPVAVIGRSGNDTVCGVNEEFRRNSGGLDLNTKSLLRCHAKYGIMENPFRSYSYVSGCFCKDGHYVDENNKCQPLSACKSEKLIDFNPKCEENEEYLTGKCNWTPRRCEYDPEGKKLKTFGHICFAPGCYCQRDFVLDENYKCVLPKDCPPHPERSSNGRWKRDINQETQIEVTNSTEVIAMDEENTVELEKVARMRLTLQFMTNDVEKAQSCMEETVDSLAQCMTK